jgi:hypothetical protein
MRLWMLLALMAFFSGAFAADQAGCRELRGGRFQGLNSTILWHARVECRASTMVWFESPAGKEGTAQGARINDLLIISDLQRTHSLSLFSPMGVDCRQNSGASSLVIAAGEWKNGARPGERQPIYRAWRVDAVNGTVGELPASDVTCVLR